ncbi:MAG: four helix bundle protein [Clostridia bacterium]
MYENKEQGLLIIPKYEKYMEYMLEVILIHLPRTEKYSIGTEFKSVMYETFKDIMFIEKIAKKERLYYLNRIDAGLNVQRALLRIMKKNRWIDETRFNYIMNSLIKEVGLILGGLIKYYAKNC